MTKVQIACEAPLRDDILAWLQDEELVHLVNIIDKVADTEKTNTAYNLAQLQFGLEFLTRVRVGTHQVKKKSLKNIFASKPIATMQELEKALLSINLDETLSALHRLNEKLTEAKAAARQTKEQLKELKPWKNLSLNPADYRDDIYHLLVTTSLNNAQALTDGLKEVRTAAWQEVSRVAIKKSGKVYFEIVAHVNDKKNVDSAVLSAKGLVKSLDLAAGESLTEKITSLIEQSAKIKKDYQDTLREGSVFLKHEDQLKKVYDALLHQQERQQIHEKTVLSPFSFTLAGWIPEKNLKQFTARLEKSFPGSAVEKVKPAKEEVAPVLFDNKKAIKPFEAVTDIYGKPRYHEIDPSPLLAIFFLVSFGLALTDAGYGIVMMISTAVALKFFKLKRAMAKMVKLLFYAGFFTFIIGSLTGGWFGITLEELPASTARDALLSIKLIDPIQQPMVLLGVAFAIGIVQLLTAWGIKAYDLWSKGDKKAALSDGVAWITMVLFVLTWAATKMGFIPAGFERILFTLMMTNAVALILTQGRQYKNIFVRLGSGVMSLYGLIGFMSDVLSYSRLLALGLATGIIGLVVNLIGGMVIEMIPVVGFAIAAVVLLVGHLFNLGINALGAFIHSGRLQFVEFFPKFIEGGGVAYKPFGRVSKYIDNPNEFS